MAFRIPLVSSNSYKYRGFRSFCPFTKYSDPKPIRKKRCFYFDKRWSEKDAVNNLVAESWREQLNGFEQSKVSFKFKKCCNSLMSWMRRGNGNSKQRIIRIKNQFNKLKNDPDHFDFLKYRILRKELGQAYKEEEAYWK